MWKFPLKNVLCVWNGKRMNWCLWKILKFNFFCSDMKQHRALRGRLSCLHQVHRLEKVSFLKRAIFSANCQVLKLMQSLKMRQFSKKHVYFDFFSSIFYFSVDVYRLFTSVIMGIAELFHLQMQKRFQWWMKNLKIEEKNWFIACWMGFLVQIAKKQREQV